MVLKIDTPAMLTIEREIGLWKRRTCTFQCILLVFLPDHQVFLGGLQESEDFASSEQSADALKKKKGIKEGFYENVLCYFNRTIQSWGFPD